MVVDRFDAHFAHAQAAALLEQQVRHDVQPLADDVVADVDQREQRAGPDERQRLAQEHQRRQRRPEVVRVGREHRDHADVHGADLHIE